MIFFPKYERERERELYLDKEISKLICLSFLPLPNKPHIKLWLDEYICTHTRKCMIVEILNLDNNKMNQLLLFRLEQ